MRDNVEALARMFDNLRFSLQKNDLSVIELLGLDPNAMPVVHDSPEDSVDNLGQELVTPDRKPKRKGHISIRRRRLFWRTTKRARACKVRAQTPRTSSSKLDSFSDFELSQRTLEPDGMDDCDMLSQVAPTPPKRARLFTKTPAGWNANCSGSAAAMNMVEVEDIEDIVFGPMPAAEPTPAPAVAAEGGSTDSGATAARADSAPAAPASRAEEVEGTKDIEDIRNINTVECIKDVECSGAAAVADVPRLPPPAEPTGADSALHVSVGTGSFDVEHEGQRDLEKRLADIEVAEYDLMSGVAWIMFEGEKVCAQGLRAAEGEVDMTWASFILDTAMGKWELELEVRDLKWTSVKNKVLPPQDREMSGGIENSRIGGQSGYGGRVANTLMGHSAMRSIANMFRNPSKGTRTSVSSPSLGTMAPHACTRSAGSRRCRSSRSRSAATEVVIKHLLGALSGIMPLSNACLFHDLALQVSDIGERQTTKDVANNIANVLIQEKFGEHTGELTDVEFQRRVRERARALRTELATR